MGKYDKYTPFSEGDNLDKSEDKISADMEVADMEKYDKQASFSVGDNLDKSEEVSSAQKKGKHTFRKLAGDFFDNINSAFFGSPLRTHFSILAITIIALILWGVWVCSMGWAYFDVGNTEGNPEVSVGSAKSLISIIMIQICIITIIGRNLRK